MLVNMNGNQVEGKNVIGGRNTNEARRGRPQAWKIANEKCPWEKKTRAKVEDMDATKRYHRRFPASIKEEVEKLENLVK